ncbi:MAG: acetyl-CoA carboxylase biotin carboxyl carrier protein [Acidobacteriota bacterium]
MAKRRTGANSTENLTLPEIERLIELISEKQFNEFELERGNFRLRLSKGVEKVLIREVAAESPALSPVAPAPIAATATPAPVVPVSAPPEESLHILTSPIVGTFYSSPSPTAGPFVSVGDSVNVGKVLCIIEAMKLMNEIQSDASGTIAKIFVENGQPIDFGQPLFGIKK